MSEKHVTGGKLWDEILKAIVDAMPEQLFPLFKEIYGKDYPKGTSITLLATESSTYQESPDTSPGSRLSDITLLVNGTDYYHLECQMHNDQDIVIRMIAYDLHFAMQYTTSADEKQGGFVMHFPRSTVIYPEKNGKLPDCLRCRIVFPDGSEHIYQIPTVRIQSYSLQEIHEKHLDLFLPYVLLRLRPRMNPRRKSQLTKKELTDFTAQVILILKDEWKQGYLTEREFDDYINLFRRAADRVLKKHADFRKEVDLMTKPLIELPSVLQKRLRTENDALIADLAEKNKQLADKDAELADKDVELANRNTLLADKDAELANKNAELARMKELLAQYHISAAT